MNRITPELFAGIASRWDLSDAAMLVLRSDNPWQQQARLLQTWWGRTQLDVAMRHDYPWRIDDKTEANNANFLSSVIAGEVERALSLEEKEQGALISEDRLRTNLLSSQPLCFNAFGELSAPGQQQTATSVLRRLWPDLVGSVDRIRYEHNPQRGEGGPTGTRSAFDVFIDVTTPEGAPGFIGIEVKYHEDLSGKPPSTSAATAAASGNRLNSLNAAAARVGADLDVVLQPRINQVWLDHALALAMLDPKVQADLALPSYKDGAFIMLSPGMNQAVTKGFVDYENAINLPDAARSTLRFTSLEELVDAFDDDLTELAQPLRARYLNMSPVEQELANVSRS